MLKETDILGWGKYKFQRLGAIDPKYLLNLIHNIGNVPPNLSEPLREFVEMNMETLKRRANGEEPMPTFKQCRKVAFERDLAERRILEISRADDRRKKQPVRTYQCPDCGFWHLTSKP